MDPRADATPAASEPAPSSRAFRDPAPPEARARELKTEIARVLVRAPTLPIDLPRFGLKLLDVVAAPPGVDLVVGLHEPVAVLRLAAIPRGGDVVPAGQLMRSRIVTCKVEPRSREASRVERALSAMASRVEAAITTDQWDAAKRLARELRALPIGIPLAHYRQIVPGVVPLQGLVRTGFLCNQDCGLCWQDRDWGTYDATQVRTWIDDLFAMGARRLIISGGEPTLDPALESHVQFARSLGFRDITLETNAVQFAKDGVATKFRDAGVTDCFVSLHSGDAEVSDRITRAPGTFVRTIRGIHALLAAGVKVNLNCVLTSEGLDHLATFPEFLHATFGRHPKLDALMLSLPTNAFDPKLDAVITPDPAKLRAVLPLAIDRAFALGLSVRGLDGPCGPPLCAFRADPRITALRTIPEPLEFREYLPGCERCAVKHACFGVRSGQVAQYGDACIAPIAS